MSDLPPNPFRNDDPYIPATLSEIQDYLAGTLGGAPKFIDDTGAFPDKNIDTEFNVLVAAFDTIRGKLGEKRYVKLIDLSARTKALFEADPNDDNGKTLEGCKLIWEMEDIIQDARQRRVDAKLQDDEGEITGD
ncbi:hypothetical protein M9978_21375 [Sphingomonas sp. MG17]|uniref:Uncharacterized protein n=1 Tax=Sphingomonas tagetis TaxID=2949092 RepID=A0A9X2KNW7_9SPHN|nr:hypothetical protein [Sphingomonas tagetis]MCP3732971.1 hypothetical protein [Sphingomonas tagetis]